ncbi:DUF2953 domain-containing protein [Paenibacillus rhizophilus]|uniref:DUF2953 domain-containing protein n=1 Tax=Paenibacillus rhizophilus TaxID=1850366 RepID=A0A3N9P9H1_9BACL|nr:DUF2953 domain-containing protein [Paenibacillus rhizophilus]RQW12888.1 DUF2953 domain-containing protein [Paenibacillus rhizophilus]
MKLWLLIGAWLLLAAAILLLSSRIFFHFSLNRRGHDDRIVLDITALFGLVKYHYTLPALVFEGLKRGLHVKLEETGIAPVKSAKEGEANIDKEDVSEWFEFGKKALRATRGLKRWTADTLSHVQITKLDWSTNFSLGDAAGTATAAGALWGLKWTVIGWTSQWVKLMRSPRLFVVPVFEDTVKFSTEVDCKGRISAGYALYAGFRLLVRAMQADEGIKQWKEIVREMRSRRREKSVA